jgi:stage II sporulation protein GA (sporulation sigma-E factor processing peptidase)
MSVVYEITKNVNGWLYNISMTIYVYADMVFLINFGINAALLALVSILCRRRAKWWRILLGGAASGLFYVLLLFSPLRVALNIFTSFVVLAPGVWIALRPRRWRDFGVNLGLAYISAFALGGLVLVIMNIAPSLSAFTGGVSTMTFAASYATILHLVAAVVISFCIIKFVRRHIANKALDKQSFRQIVIYLGDKSVQMQALVDTGMTLIEPISQKPVVIAEFCALSPLLPPPVKELYENKHQDDLESITKGFIEADLQTRIRMVPFRSLGRPNGVLTGFRPDKIEIIDKTLTTETKDVIIGICDFKLGDGEYVALINPILCN